MLDTIAKRFRRTVSSTGNRACAGFLLAAPALFLLSSCDAFGQVCDDGLCEALPGLILMSVNTSQSASVVDNSDGTVTIQERSLMWAKCGQVDTTGVNLFSSASNNCSAGTAGSFAFCVDGTADCDSGTILNGSGTPVSDNQAWNTCNTLTLAGHGDWRVPTIAELADFYHRSWVFHQSAFPSTVSAYYQSSAAADAANNRVVHFSATGDGGAVAIVAKSATYPVRCVRAL